MSYRIVYGNSPVIKAKTTEFSCIDDAELFAEGILAGFNMLNKDASTHHVPLFLYLEEITGWSRVKSWNS